MMLFVYKLKSQSLLRFLHIKHICALFYAVVVRDTTQTRQPVFFIIRSWAPKTKRNELDIIRIKSVTAHQTPPPLQSSGFKAIDPYLVASKNWVVLTKNAIRGARGEFCCCGKGGES